MSEFTLLHKTGPNLASLSLKANFYDDCESFLPLESNFVDDAPLIYQEEVFDPFLTYLPLFGPSSSCMTIDTSIIASTLLVSPLFLA